MLGAARMSQNLTVPLHLQDCDLCALRHRADCAPHWELELLKGKILWGLKVLWLSCCPTKRASR